MGKTREELERLWSDPKNWKWWCYNCPQDPRIIVPKRRRWAGWTINFAHASARWWLVALMILTAGPFVLVTVYLASRQELNFPLQFSVFFGSIATLMLICAYFSDYKDYSK